MAGHIAVHCIRLEIAHHCPQSLEIMHLVAIELVCLGVRPSMFVEPTLCTTSTDHLSVCALP